MKRMPELSHRRRMLVLSICCMSLLIVSLDTTALNVALPSMQRGLDATTAGLQWTIDAYTLVLASLLMLAGSTADRIGRKRVFMAGLVVFTVGSALCSAAPNLEALFADHSLTKRQRECLVDELEQRDFAKDLSNRK